MWKSKKYFLMIWTIFVGFFNALLFICVSLAKDSEKYFKSPGFWTIYAFIMFALIALLIVDLVANKNPQARIRSSLDTCFIFVCVNIALGIILLIISAFIKTPFPFIAAFIPFLVVLAILAVYFVFSMKNEAMLQENPQLVPEVISMAELPEYLNTINQQVSDSATKTLLQQAIDLSKNYTESMGNEDVLRVEKSIFEYARRIRIDVKQGQNVNIFNNIQKVIDLLKDRENYVNKK